MFSVINSYENYNVRMFQYYTVIGKPSKKSFKILIQYTDSFVYFHWCSAGSTECLVDRPGTTKFAQPIHHAEQVARYYDVDRQCQLSFGKDHVICPFMVCITMVTLVEMLIFVDSSYVFFKFFWLHITHYQM